MGVAYFDVSGGRHLLARMSFAIKMGEQSGSFAIELKELAERLTLGLVSADYLACLTRLSLLDFYQLLRWVGDHWDLLCHYKVISYIIDLFKPSYRGL